MFSPLAGSLNAGLAVSEFRCYLAVLIDVSNNTRKMFSPVAGSLNAGLAVSELEEVDISMGRTHIDGDQ